MGYALHARLIVNVSHNYYYYDGYMFLVFDSIERYAPGFKESVVGRDILTPPDLEGIFGLTGGVSVVLLRQLLNIPSSSSP